VTLLRGFAATEGKPRAPLALLLLACSLSSFALGAGQGLPSEARRAKEGDSLQQLREFLTQTSSARGEFSQATLKGPASHAPQKSGGTFEFVRPGRFRWITTSPYQQTIVSDGGKLYVYDPDLNQVTVKKLKGAIPASPASILFGSNDFERDFQIASDGARDGVEWILATPRTQDSSFERIRIGFRDGLPVAMDLTDSFGQTTELRFSGLQRNPKIDPARFRFDPPKGADVLEQ
jgi:outer membrane lipoprotein carrier protein